MYLLLDTPRPCTWLSGVVDAEYSYRLAYDRLLRRISTFTVGLGMPWTSRIMRLSDPSNSSQPSYPGAPEQRMEKEAHPNSGLKRLRWQQEMAGRTTISSREKYLDDKYLLHDLTFEDRNSNWNYQDKSSAWSFQNKKPDWSSKDNNSDWTFQKMDSTTIDKNCDWTIQFQMPNWPSQDERSGLTCQEDEAHAKAVKGVFRGSILILFSVILLMFLLMKASFVHSCFRQQEMASKTTNSEKKKVLDKAFYLMEQAKHYIEFLKNALKPDHPGFGRVIASTFTLFLVVAQIYLLVKVPTLECFCYIGIPFFLQITHFEAFSSLYPPMFCMEGWLQFGALIVSHISLALAHLVCYTVD